MQKINKKILVLILAIMVVVAGLLIYTSDPQQNQHKEQSSTEVHTAFITIEGLYEYKKVDFTTNQTVLQLLQVLNQSDSRVALKTKEYSGMGTLVEGMVGKENGDENRYWQYTINGVMPQMGADMLEIKEGDRVEWHFVESEF